MPWISNFTHASRRINLQIEWIYEPRIVNICIISCIYTDISHNALLTLEIHETWGIQLQYNQKIDEFGKQISSAEDGISIFYSRYLHYSRTNVNFQKEKNRRYILTGSEFFHKISLLYMYKLYIYMYAYTHPTDY